ncbi:unnamed protein product [Mytilus edulis]|uniref:Uncharacterized protein n=1 Tax=Mytilus edulis TaxID=6550 RepID=A0A8S3PPQ0_MYTED|nr:unnamed protein product [Mytilus edulis]
MWQRYEAEITVKTYTRFEVLSNICQECNKVACACDNDNLLIDINGTCSKSLINNNVDSVCVINNMEVLPEANECVNANKGEIAGEKGSGLQIECKRINGPQLLSSFGLQKRGLKIANLNIQHILPKIEEIRLILNEKKSLHILGLCETFLNP